MRQLVGCDPQTFLRSGGTAEELKTRFNIDVRRHPRYRSLVHLKYGHVSNDFSHVIVRQSRGLILDEHRKWAIVARPFDKFFNFGEPLAPTLDWTTARFYEKLDGTCCYLWFHENAWNLSTLGSPDASGEVEGSPGLNYGGLFWATFKKYGFRVPRSDVYRDYTFMFELMTPLNRIVVRHEEPTLRLIGVRSNNTGLYLRHEYFQEFLGVEPYDKIHSIAEAQETFFSESSDPRAPRANDPMKMEGYVVVDQYDNMVKIKHPTYVMIHHMRESATPRNLLRMVVQGESDEWLTYFPEWKPAMQEIAGRFDGLKAHLESDWRRLCAKHDAMDYGDSRAHRKGFAQDAIKCPMPGVLFRLYDKHAKTVQEALMKMTENSVYQHLGLDSIPVVRGVVPPDEAAPEEQALDAEFVELGEAGA